MPQKVWLHVDKNTGLLITLISQGFPPPAIWDICGSLVRSCLLLNKACGVRVHTLVYTLRAVVCMTNFSCSLSPIVGLTKVPFSSVSGKSIKNAITRTE